MSSDRPTGGLGGTPAHDSLAVGAYLLGSLDPEERRAFERHLESCDACRAELRELESLPDLLDRIDLSDLEAGPPADDALFGRIAAAIGADRDRERLRRRRRLSLVGAAAAVAAGGTAAGVVLSSAGAGTVAAQHTFSVTDGRMHLAVRLASEPNGTGLDVSVSGLPVDVHCRLIAVSASGRREVAGSWTASYAGTAHVSGLETSFRPSQLSRIILRISGTHRRLAVDV